LRDQKPSVLIVVSSLFKAEGQMAKAISQIVHDVDFYFFSALEFKYRIKEFEKLIKNVDAIHWLVNRSSIPLEVLKMTEGIQQISTIHHLCPEENDKLSAAQGTQIIHVVAKEWETAIRKSVKDVPVILARLGIYTSSFAKTTKGIQSKKKVIGLMGFYPGAHNRKSPDVALDALRDLNKRFDQIIVKLQGAGWEDFCKELKANNIEYELSDYSSKSKSDLFFNNVDVFLCTSDYEGGPLPVLEALSSSVPVVSTKVGVAQEILKNGGGVLCEKGDSKALSSALYSLLTDIELYNNHKGVAKKSVSSLDWSNLAKEYSTLYKQILSAAKQHSSEKLLPPQVQQRKEQEYGNIQEGLSLLYHGKKWIGLKLVIASQLSRHVSLKRKLNTQKRVFKYLIQGVRT
jgi:glycosyltransferase involved in cell wall biosynthesis